MGVKKVFESSEIYMKAQSVIERSKNYNDQAASILESSNGADGEVSANQLP